MVEYLVSTGPVGAAAFQCAVAGLACWLLWSGLRDRRQWYPRRLCRYRYQCAGLSRLSGLAFNGTGGLHRPRSLSTHQFRLPMPNGMHVRQATPIRASLVGPARMPAYRHRFDAISTPENTSETGESRL